MPYVSTLGSKKKIFIKYLREPSFVILAVPIRQIPKAFWNHPLDLPARPFPHVQCFHREKEGMPFLKGSAEPFV